MIGRSTWSISRVGVCIAMFAIAGGCDDGKPARRAKVKRVDGGPTRLQVTVHGDGTETVEEVPAEYRVAGALATSLPDECKSPVGFAVMIACAGGGRPFLEGFLDRVRDVMGPEEARLTALAAKMPAARLDDKSFETVKRVYTTLLTEHAPRLFDDAKGAKRFTKEIAGLDDTAIYHALRKPGLHYNAANGLLGVNSMLSASPDREARLAKGPSAFGWDRARSDESDARILGESFGQVAFAMSVMRYAPGEVGALFAGPATAPAP